MGKTGSRGWEKRTITLQWKMMVTDGMKAATLGLQGRSQPGSWHNSPAKKGKNHPSISPPKIEVIYYKPRWSRCSGAKSSAVGEREAVNKAESGRRGNKQLSKAGGRKAAHNGEPDHPLRPSLQKGHDHRSRALGNHVAQTRVSGSTISV